MKSKFALLSCFASTMAVSLFGATPGSHQTIFIDRPDYQFVEQPPAYLGASAPELQGNGFFLVADPIVQIADIQWADTNSDGYGEVPTGVSWELSEHYLLNQLVEDLAGDPIALAAYVQNEIKLVNGYQQRVSSASSSPWLGTPLESLTISRGATGAYMEKQGSPWEQCSLLVYLLRRAGYAAAVVEAPKFQYQDGGGNPIADVNVMSLRMDRLDRMFGFRLVESFSPDQALYADYPWVVVNDAKDGSGTWRHLFPWIKDVIVEEGFNPYDYLPAAYDSGEKWVEQYFQNDPAIVGLAEEDEVNSAGQLFSRFIGQYIADDALSLEDMGFHSYYRKSQYNEWSDFPRPFAVGFFAFQSSNPLGQLMNPVVKDAPLNTDPTDQFRFGRVKLTVRDLSNNVHLQTSLMPMAQLTNRRLYFYRDGSGNIGLKMDALNPAGTVAGGDFTSTDLPGAQLQTAADPGGYLSLAIQYFGVADIGETGPTENRGLPNGQSVSAIVLNNGAVSPEMMDEVYQAFEEERTTSTPSDLELAAHTAFLAGQLYWKNAREDQNELTRMHKIYEYLFYGACISSYQAVGTTFDTPSIDVPVVTGTYINGSIHPDDPSLPDRTITERDYTIMEVATFSSHEHEAINRIYGTDNAISTVRLLQIANRDFATGSGLNPEGYYEFTRAEFDAADSDPQYATLKSDAGNLWTSTRELMGYGDPSYENVGWERVYITPFDISMDTDTGETSNFNGMGILATSSSGLGALIDPGLNGAFGPTFTPDLIQDLINGDKILQIDANGDLVIGDEPHPTDSTNPDPQTEKEREEANERNDTTGTDPTGPQDKGDVGTPENNDSKDDVGDPVDPVTGKFVSDHVDLTLNGPFPLQLRRNYSSFNVAHNLFGYGWKLNFMPYINVKADDSAVFAADLDGTVVQYTLVPASSPMRWEASTDAADNPYLDNNYGGSIGGQSNRYANYIEKTTEGADTVYTLYKPNGHEARYIVRSFPIDLGAGTVQRTRPYLDTWEDALGNTMTFSYYETSTQPEYGQLRRIESSNGNFLGFLYNHQREITEAFTNDGRRIYYRYDNRGDLREVTLPDNAVIQYDYKYLTDSVSGEVYSTHLIERVTKPDGRVLENTYDPLYDPEVPAQSDVTLRRVVSQKATVGDTLELVENAVYEYFAANDAGVTDPTAQPWTQAGFDVTLVHSDVRPQFGRLTTIYVHQDGLKRFIADPLAPAGFAPGNTDLDHVLTYEYYTAGETDGFARSLKRMRDKRGLEMLYEYDSLGNLKKSTKRGDITGDGTSEDISTFFFYDAVNYLPTKVIYPAETAGGTNRVVLNTYADTGAAKRADDLSNPGFELYRFLPQTTATYEVVAAPIDASTPNSGDEQATLTFLYDHEEDVSTGDIAYGLLKSTRHQGADDVDDKTRTDYTHNARGFITSSTEFTFSGDTNVVTNFEYNVRGELEEKTDSAGRVVRFDYDMLGRLTHTEKFNTASESLPTWWSFNHYNLNGDLTWTDGPRYGVEDYVFRDYDGAGRVLAEVVWRSEAVPNGSGVRPVADQNSFLGQAITYYDYDSFGNLTSTIDPRGNETLLDYDELGRMVTKTHPTVGSVTAEEEFTYEPGNLVKTYTNALGGTTNKLYTAHGSLKQSDAPAVDGRSESWTYYLDGRKRTRTRSNGAVTTWTYNDAARTTTMETVKDSVLLEKTITHFDTRGNKIQRDVFVEGSQFNTFTTNYDGLNRVSQSSGPPEQLRGSPAETASALQQTDFSYTYSTTGDRYTVTATTDGEQSIEVFDGIGRPSRSEKRDASNNLHSQESYTYTANHLFVFTRFGSDTDDDRLQISATNTFGQNVLTIFADNTYTRRVYDKAGNLTESYDEETLTDGSPRVAYAYDARNRMATETKLDGSVTSFEYDAGNNPVLRSMPGGIKHHQAFDAAGRIIGEYLEGSGSSTSRDIDYNYFTTTEDIGLLQSRIENTGTSDQITHSYLYDDLLRLERYSCDGANYTGFAHRYEYDLRSLLTSITRAPTGIAGDQLSTQIVHDLDGYGQLLEERVYTGKGTVDSFNATALHSHIRQSWDGLGRRNRFGLGSDVTPMGSVAPTFDYDFYASGRIAAIAPGAFSDPWEVQYDYEDNLLLSERRFRVDGSYNARRTQTLNRRLDNTTPYRDARGRLLRNVQTANGVAVLNETLAWSDDSKLGAYTLARGAGTGTAWDDFTDSRSHTYDPENRRLETESFLPEPSASTRTFNYDFDSDDLGVRVKAALDNPATDAWEVNSPDTTGLDAFMRVVDETARSGKRSFTVSGSSTGPGIFELFLGEGASPSTFEFLQSINPDVDYGDGTWSIPLSLEAGQYTLEARGTHLHPDSNYQATDSSTFTVAAPVPASITTTYDAHGRVETRSWASGDVVQTFSWDAKGNLLEIEQVDSGTTETVGSYIWTAQYDGLGRRIQTDYAPAGASAIAIAQNRIKTWFDPQVEFMVAAVEHHGKREWMVHGPDLDTGYGSFQGLGGLEALVDEATGETTPIVDTVHGHVIATIDLGDIANAADDTVIFKEQQFGGYGPLPGSQQQPLEVTEDLTESLGWQTRCIDPTSFFAMGARHYDPLSGRFLSADPLGHGATPDLYSYAGGDPLNFFDPTGRKYKQGDPIGKEEEKGFWGHFWDEVKELNEMQKAASNAITDSIGNFLMDEGPKMVGDAMHIAVGDVQHEGYSDTYKELTDPNRPTVEFFGVDFDAPILATPATETVEAYDAGYDTGTAFIEGDYDAAKAAAVIALVELVDRRTPGNTDGDKLYRGVPNTNSEKARLAEQGVVKPRGTATDSYSLERHVRNEDVSSGVTSWTTDRDIAKTFSGTDGTIIEVDAGSAADRVVPKPDIERYGYEKEFLLEGTIQGTPTKP